MTTMRQWLDHERYELSRFTCNREGNTVVVCIAFSADGLLSRSQNAFSLKTRRSDRHISLQSVF